MIADAQERSTNDKVRYQWELLLGPRYCKSLLQKPINEITTLDIEQVLRPVWRSKPETGRKLLVRLRRVFDYARVHLRDRHGIVMPSNPAAWQDLRDRGFERISKLTRGRQAALDYQQAPEFFAAISQRQGMAARALEVTLLTGLRTGEVIGATWTEIDLEHKTSVIPPRASQGPQNSDRAPSGAVVAPSGSNPEGTAEIRRVCVPGPQAGQTAEQHGDAERSEGHELRRIWRASLGRPQERTPNHSTRTTSHI